MKQLPAGLADHLSGAATTLCRCWKLTRRDGAELGFTDHDRDVVFDGVTFQAGSGLAAGELEQANGFNADTQEVSGAFDSALLTEADLRAGRYDGAQIELWMVNWADVEDRLLDRIFTLGETVAEDGAFRVELRGLAADMDQTQGRRFTRNCDADLGDTRCGVNLDSALFKASAAVTAVKQGLVFTMSGLAAYASGWFSGGRITFETGGNAGLSMEIASHDLHENGEATVQLWKSLPADIAPGDQLTIRAGCDKQFATCREKFANTPRFRGFPHIPGNDFSLGYASRNAVMDGGPLVE